MEDEILSAEQIVEWGFVRSLLSSKLRGSYILGQNNSQVILEKYENGILTGFWGDGSICRIFHLVVVFSKPTPDIAVTDEFSINIQDSSLYS